MSRRVVVLGLDGVPDWLLRQLAGEGVMPHAARLLAQGDLRAMGTVYPRYPPSHEPPSPQA